MTDKPDPTVEVRNNAAANRYEITVNGELAGFADYRVGERVVFSHTVVDPAFEGRGLASTLMGVALDEARLLDKTVVAQCTYVAGFIGRHPQYQDLLLER